MMSYAIKEPSCSGSSQVSDPPELEPAQHLDLLRQRDGIPIDQYGAFRVLQKPYPSKPIKPDSTTSTTNINISKLLYRWRYPGKSTGKSPGRSFALSPTTKALSAHFDIGGRLGPRVPITLFSEPIGTKDLAEFSIPGLATTAPQIVVEVFGSVTAAADVDISWGLDVKIPDGASITVENPESGNPSLTFLNFVGGVIGAALRNDIIFNQIKSVDKDLPNETFPLPELDQCLAWKSNSNGIGSFSSLGTQVRAVPTTTVGNAITTAHSTNTGSSAGAASKTGTVAGSASSSLPAPLGSGKSILRVATDIASLPPASPSGSKNPLIRTAIATVPTTPTSLPGLWNPPTRTSSQSPSLASVTAAQK
ncbi:hypothetical protein VTL71DRAFT_10809 [Oculimacula yallundae]|uniref:Uncharacterized protein n=1 Tax=Oculimacula yallundae TaxID=86028 RepID=A0ABR4CUN5_9HELO